MKKLTLTLGVILFTFASTFAQKLNTEQSKVNWTGYKVVGSNHTGTVAVKDGELKIKKGKVQEGTIVIDLSSLTSTDLEGEWQQKLNGHLKSADFFHVEEHPTATFTLKEVSHEGDVHKLKGDLTIKGVTKEIAFDSKLSKEGKVHVLEGKIKIDRTKFGLKYGSDSFFDNLGDKAIADEFDIDFKVQTI
ncbi:YceI family protein [Flammeovirga yaeyamensis]|uniref:YceI family protein n=1 Tax=Flammeovirga yaeyamensis TaxID=367791 RepID=A0AAX1N4I5_9BACT|nr:MULTISPECIES: YceI family protein [Flammeovirga]ANQ47809.1 YceI family protein [Flammeovirga sp. MY04]MBB3700277.1 polyisoprenoid-binding protein YceI [Flammeovirga yaeyamensis]NMF37097.1 YceI family protein [Flammeovirga yaeyamensis]QWG00788.1 YceI family protein [Flammeovirga yaeyamensis]